ncbi:MAG: molecular chaperone HtpG, partial [Candidatus Berkiella sp.]
QSVAQGALDSLDFSEEEKSPEAKKEEQEKQLEGFKDTLEKIKEVLKEKIKDVRLTERLTISPACIVVDEDQMTSQMERLLRSAGQDIKLKPILELNPQHLLVQRLKEEGNQEHFKDLSYILYDQAVLSEGGQLEDPATFVKKFNELLLNVAK